MINITKHERALHEAACHCRDCELSRVRFILYKIFEYLVIWLIGGAAYVGIEMLWRGHSHWSMFILGGLCLLIVGFLNEGVFKEDMGIIQQMLIGALVITVLEFATGCIVNLRLGLDVWDYSDAPLNIMGQICLPFTIAWFFLSFVAIRVDDEIRYRLFNEPKPKYVLWSMKD